MVWHGMSSIVFQQKCANVWFGSSVKDVSQVHQSVRKCSSKCTTMSVQVSLRVHQNRHTYISVCKCTLKCASVQKSAPKYARRESKCAKVCTSVRQGVQVCIKCATMSVQLQLDRVKWGKWMQEQIRIIIQKCPTGGSCYEDGDDEI